MEACSTGRRHRALPKLSLYIILLLYTVPNFSPSWRAASVSGLSFSKSPDQLKTKVILGGAKEGGCWLWDIEACEGGLMRNQQVTCEINLPLLNMTKNRQELHVSNSGWGKLEILFPYWLGPYKEHVSTNLHFYRFNDHIVQVHYPGHDTVYCWAMMTWWPRLQREAVPHQNWLTFSFALQQLRLLVQKWPPLPWNFSENQSFLVGGCFPSLCW